MEPRVYSDDPRTLTALLNMDSLQKCQSGWQPGGNHLNIYLPNKSALDADNKLSIFCVCNSTRSSKTENDFLLVT